MRIFLFFTLLIGHSVKANTIGELTSKVDYWGYFFLALVFLVLALIAYTIEYISLHRNHLAHYCSKIFNHYKIYVKKGYSRFWDLMENGIPQK